MAESPYAAIKIPHFRLLLVGRLLVTIAIQIQIMAVGWQVWGLTKNSLMLGLIGLVEVIPSISVALYAGHVADKVDRRTIARAVIAALLMIMALLCFCSYAIKNVEVLIPAIYVLIAISGLARGFYGPAVFGLVSDIVPRPLMGNAAAWNSAVWQASAVVGPILGGYLYLWSSAPATYLVSTLLLIGALACFAFLQCEFLAPEQTDQSSVVANIKEGLHFVFSNQVILGAMALDLFAVLFGGAVALLPIFAQEIFHQGPQTLGMLRAAPSVGAFLTAAFLTHRPITKHAGRILLVSVAGFGLCMIGFGLSTNFYLSLFLLGLSGTLDGVSVYLRTTIFQLATPNDMKGRVSAVNNIFIGSSNEIGEFESGVTAKIMGLVPSVVFGGCMTLFVVLTTAFKAPKLRRLNMQTLFKEEVVEPSVN